ncbi:MAG: MBL fold metallo-hydrolase [Candidatus Helarchaeota archaeon]
MEDFNDWIKIIKQTEFNQVFNYLIIDKQIILFDISSHKTVRIIADFPPNYLIISHFHLDHQTGKNLLKKRYKSKIVAHELESNSIENLQGFYHNYNFLNGTDLINELHLKYWHFKDIKVDIKVYDNYEFNIGTHILKVIHTPGTTPGHICLFDEENRILFAGDMGPKELPVYNAITSNLTQYLNSYDKIIKINPCIVLSAHFPPIFEKVKQAYIKAKERIIKRENRILEILEKKKSLTLDEIASENPTIPKKPGNSIILNWLKFAEKIQTLHHLNKLAKENKVKSDDNFRWELI